MSLVNDELVRMRREVVVAEFEVKSRQFCRVIEKNYVNPEVKITHFLADIRTCDVCHVVNV